MASRFKHYSTADTYTIERVNRLDRVVVNSGVSGATVTIRFAASDGVIASIAADDPDIGRVYDIVFGGFGANLEVVLSHDTDVTVVYG